jgi:hypothetical protein
MKYHLRITGVIAGLIALSCLPLAAQNVTLVSAGENTLSAAVANASDGDILELVDDGGVYLYTEESDKIEVTHVITIRAKEGLANRPIIRNLRPSGSTSTRNFEVIPGGSLTLIGLEFDGSGDGSGVPYSKQAIRLNAGDSSNVVLKIYDCYFHDYTENFLRGYTKTVVDTLIIQNTVSTGSIREGWMLYDTSNGGPAVNYALFENLTISNVGREAIKIGSADSGYDPEVIINHVTMDSTSLGGDYRVIRTNAGTIPVANATIKNCIISNQMGAYQYSLQLYGTSTVSYCDTFHVRAVNLNESAAIGGGIVSGDPLYTDPANLDYTLQEGSPALTAADDGYAMGDIRWDPNAKMPKVIQVYAGENTLYDAVQTAESGDILELMDNGGVYVYTMESDKIEIDKVLTIRARDGLTQRPIIRNLRPGGSTSTRNFEVLSGGSLTLIGLEFDGSGDGSEIPYSKQAIRLNAGDSSHVFLKIYDCYFHDYTENFVRGYRLTVIDTLIIQNTVSTGSVREGWMLYDTSSDGPALNYALFENVTITNLGREAIKIGSAANGYDPEVIINHVTIDSVSLGGDYRAIRTNAGSIPAGNVTIKNCIISNQMGGYGNYTSLYGTSTVSYTDTFNVRPAALNDAAAIGAGMIGADPMYKDPASLDYRLALSSLARGAADDGKAMGDLRWEADPAQFMLTVLTDGPGTVEVDPAGPYYDANTVVTLTAVPDAGNKLIGWEGVTVFPPDNPVVTVTMTEDITVKALFESLKPKYSFTVSTLGLGHVDLNPAPLDGDVYREGTLVTLTAVADTSTWAFVGWSGAISGSENPTTVSVDSVMNITAAFASTLTQFTLTLNVEGKGSIVPDPEPILGTYDTATVVSLEAMADLGWEFSGWSGDISGSTNPVVVNMDSNITLTASFTELVFSGGAMEIDTTWDLRDAVEFANNNSYIDTLVLVTSGGLYTSYSTSDVAVWQPLTVMAKPGLEKMPVITNSDPEAANDDIFRVFNDFTLIGVEMDGGNALSHGMKYGVRLSNYTVDTVKTGSNITIRDCYFHDFFENKSPTADGHAFKIDVNVKAGDVLIENTTFKSFGYESIRISDTEKWATDGALKSLTIRNCTFVDIDAECVRYYSDLDPATPDAPVLLEHITVNNSATRAFFLKNSGGAIARDIIISNSRQSGHGRDADLMDVQGNTDLPSFVSHVDTFNVKPVPILSADGEVDSTTIYGFDPMYKDADNLDFTLMPGSPAYGKGHDESPLGDLRWVDPTVAVEGTGEMVPLRYSLEQNYPNPFNPSTRIKFSIKEAGVTTLKIYDVLGREVATLVDQKMAPGEYEVEFYNPNLATGLYFYQLKSQNFVKTKKMLLVK